jgi:AraC family transcriptional regulator of adaptative response/methylated-DNA-[protein]-cysteine methyltransferase
MTTRCIYFIVRPCSLGSLLVAATERGVCFVRLGDSRAELELRLAEAFPFAPLESAETGAVAEWAQALADQLDGKRDSAEVQLDVSGSSLERRVGQELRRIRVGGLPRLMPPDRSVRARSAG